MIAACTSREFFEAKYQENADPWSFASSPVELSRYDRIIQALGNRRYREAFEPACSVGVLTERLASCCDRVLAFDLAETAVSSAKARCAHLPHVNLRCASLDEMIPGPEVDLLILSEVGYYHSSADWGRIFDQLARVVSPGCIVLAAHWLGSSEDHCISGDEVHRILRSNELMILQHEERYEQFRLDRLVRA